MTKADYIDYWKTTAEKDRLAVGHLFEKGDFWHSLFFAHLMLEKLLKAHWVKDSSTDFPPKTHNLMLLVSQTGLAPSVEQLRLLSRVNQFQLDGRYPDYKLNMFKIATEDYTQQLLHEIDLVQKWLENSL